MVEGAGAGVVVDARQQRRRRRAELGADLDQRAGGDRRIGPGHVDDAIAVEGQPFDLVDARRAQERREELARAVAGEAQEHGVVGPAVGRRQRVEREEVRVGRICAEGRLALAIHADDGAELVAQAEVGAVADIAAAGRDLADEQVVVGGMVGVARSLQRRTSREGIRAALARGVSRTLAVDGDVLDLVECLTTEVAGPGDRAGAGDLDREAVLVAAGVMTLEGECCRAQVLRGRFGGFGA